MNASSQSWQFWAVLSAIFAALTAILAKIGIDGVSSDFAMLFRTIVIVLAFSLILALTRQTPHLAMIGKRTYLFLTLSGLGTGASWLCYFRALQLGDASQVAPVDKLSVVMVAVLSVALLGERLSLINWLGVISVAFGAVLVAYR